MKEVDLRKWHRQMGIILAFFLILQAGSGLIITVLDMADTPDTPAHAESGKDAGANPVATAPSSGHDEEGESVLMEIMDQIHHGLGVGGAYYRIVLGVLVIGQAFGGFLIYQKIKQRSHGSRAKTN